jgi:hypothetical protein
VLGVSAIISMSRSGGRLTGRGLAVAGIVLGLLGQMLWCGGAIGLTKFFADLAPLGQLMAAIDRGEYATARPDLSAEAAAAGDEQFEAFRTAYRQEAGALKRFPKGLGGVLAAHLRVGPAWGPGMKQAERIYGRRSAIPMAADFDQGTRLVLFVPDKSAGAGSAGVRRIRNVGVVAPDGSITWLVDPAAGP